MLRRGDLWTSVWMSKRLQDRNNWHNQPEVHMQLNHDCISTSCLGGLGGSVHHVYAAISTLHFILFANGHPPLDSFVRRRRMGITKSCALLGAAMFIVLTVVLWIWGTLIWLYYLFSPPTASSNHSRTRSFHLPVFCLKEDKVGWLGDSGILSIHSSPKCGWAHGAFWSSSTAFLLWARWVNWFVSLCLDVFGSVSSAKCQKVPQFQFRMIAPWAPNLIVSGLFVVSFTSLAVFTFILCRYHDRIEISWWEKRRSANSNLAISSLWIA